MFVKTNLIKILCEFMGWLNISLLQKGRIIT